MTRRAQTIHDYLLGIVLIVLTIGVAIGLLGSAYEPFFDPVSNEEQNMADNLGDELVDVHSTTWGDRTVDLGALDASISDEDALEDLRLRAGIPEWKSVNVTIQHDREVIVSGGDAMTGEPDARSVRSIRSIQIDGQYGACSDGCRIVVRVW